MNESTISLIIKSIIVQQSQIIGPMAVSEANKVSGLQVSIDLQSITVNGNSKEILISLVRQYERLFGQASVEACKDSIKEILPKISAGDIPDFLR